ncbi:2,3-bisphosphoglycerate-independent phosphoglycerate mutase [Parahaliea mediterranea]|uniref:2,3-bisphosphoglycerate-independent phosphoglycerate mutase n=1 Tax=Parahaliea mediterranea TaxID=651086 RepID=A0A939IP43_9GAMM|nr:2,3-bisphosphoglycerate-independent phosphoglycerate mutase [Parahaliea mediterranea]MBN7798783.1 2,3-bisphosphoglycerate-independent phosphoglycerate mutase [Parahaliea mediterranea]
MSNTTKQPTVLIVLDGWGYREDSRDNAIANANTPVWDRLWSEAPHTLISGSGLDVGLPEGQMGNSEVGHMSLGAGRVIYQNITRIDKAIADGSFEANAAYTDAIDGAVEKGGAVHVLGLLSPGGVHSHEEQLFAAVRMAARRGAERVYLHAFLDGRDTPPRSAGASLEKADALFGELGCGRVASIVGRYFAMDRDNRWDRVEQAWSLLTRAEAPFSADTSAQALQAAYERDETDEFVQPTLVGGDDAAIADGDAVLFMNFRADRARQLSRAFTQTDFDGFDRGHVPALAGFVTTTEYAADIDAPVAFPPEALTNVLGDYLAQRGGTQLRIAETEKYAHVTFFFSGGREQEFPGEERIMVPSPDVATYDLKPEMSAPEVTDKLVAAICSGKYDLIVCNYANGDMVGHTGVYDAAVKAVEALDTCLGRVEQALRECGGQALVTADHGNCEQMQDYESGQRHTQHTTEEVPLVYLGQRHLDLDPAGGILADIAPTLLALMGLEQPPEMTGRSLARLSD